MGYKDIMLKTARKGLEGLETGISVAKKLPRDRKAFLLRQGRSGVSGPNKLIDYVEPVAGNMYTGLSVSRKAGTAIGTTAAIGGLAHGAIAANPDKQSREQLQMASQMAGQSQRIAGKNYTLGASGSMVLGMYNKR